MRCILLAVFGLVLTIPALAATPFSSVIDGDWGVPQTWGKAANATPVEGIDYPGPDDPVTIGAHYLTVSGVNRCASLDMTNNLNRSASTNFNCQVTITGKLTVFGAVALAAGNANRGKRITVNPGNNALGFQCTSLSLTGAGANNRRAYIEIGDGTVQVDTVSFAGAGAQQGIAFTHESACLRIANSFGAGTFFLANDAGGSTLTRGTVEYSGTDAAVKGLTYNNLTLSGTGSVSLPGFPNCSVNGMLRILNAGNGTQPIVSPSQPLDVGSFEQSSGVFNAGALTHVVKSNFTVVTDAVFNAESSTIQFTSGPSHQVSSAAAFNNLQVDALNTIELTANLTVKKDLTIAGALHAAAFDVSIQEGDVSVSGELTSSTGAITLQNAGAFGGSGLVDIYDLVLANAAAPATTTLTGNITVANQLNVESDRTLEAGTFSIRLEGTGAGVSQPFLVNGVFDSDTSTVQYTPLTAAATEIAALAYKNLTLQGLAGSQLSLPGSASVSGTLNVSDADVTLTIDGVMDLGATGVLDEGANQNTVGEIQATSSTNSASFSERGLGITIVDNGNGAAGSLTISRFSNTAPPGTGVSVANPISRYWLINNGGVPVDSRISFGFFAATELNGNTLDSLVAFKSEDSGTTWAPVYSSTRGNPTLADVSSFSLWTLAPVAATTVSIETAANGSGAIVSGNFNAGDAISAFAIVRDAADNFGGNPAANWSFTLGSGTFFGEFNNDTSVATTVFNARNVGTGTLRATVAGLGFGDSGTISIAPGLPASLSIVAGNSQVAEAGTAVTIAPAVKVLDLFGNAVPGASVAFAPSIGGSVTASPAISNAAGIATVGSWKLSSVPGVNTLDASVSDGMNSFTAQFSANGNVAPFSLSILVGPSEAEAGAVQSPALKVQIKNPLGNDAALPGIPVTVALTSGGGTLQGTVLQLTDDDGIATFEDLSIKQASAGKKLKFSSPTMTSAVSAAFEIFPAAASQIVILQQPTNAVAGQGIAPFVTARLRDLYGNDVRESDVRIAVTLGSGAGTLMGTTARDTDVDGIATFDDLNIDLVGSDKVLTFSGNSLDGVSSTVFSIFVDTPSRFGMVPAFTEQAAGEANLLAITVVDAFGNLTGFTGTKTVTFSGASIAPDSTTQPTVTNGAVTPVSIPFDSPTSLTFTNGICTRGGSMRLYRVEGAIVSINDTDADPLGGESIFVQVTPGAPASFDMNFVSSQPNATPFAGTNTLTAVDAYFNVVTDYDQRTPAANYDVTISIQQGLTGTLTGGSVAQSSFVNGVADLENVLTYTGPTGDGLLRATAGNGIFNLAGVSIFWGALHHFEISQILEAPAFAGVEISFSVTAQDISGNTVMSHTGAGTGVTVSTDKGAGDVLTGESTGNFQDGFLTQHAVSLKFARSNASLTVTGSGKSGTSNQFDVQPNTATTLVFLTQPGDGISGALLGRQPVLQSRDSFGNNSTVDTDFISATLALQNADGSPTTAILSGDATVDLDGTGRARFTNLKINRSGSYRFVASGLPTGAVSSSFSVVPAIAKVVVGTSAGTVLSGTPITFTATLTAVAPGEGTPGGNVAFKDGTTVLGSSALVNGVATLATSSLSVGTHSITVEYAGDASFTAATSDAITQTVQAQPSIATVTPAVGVTAGGTSVQIDGANFLAGAAVLFDGVAATKIVVVSDSRITATTPAHASGSVTLTITNPTGLVATLPNAFFYNAPPTSSSGIVFIPALPRLGEIVTATLGVSDPESDGLTTTFDWGDGSVAGESTHTYTTEGVFTVVATIKDGLNTFTLSQTLTIGAAALPSEPLTIIAKKITAKNPSTGKDSVQISGTVTLPEGTLNLDGAISERFGSIKRDYTLVKGKARNGTSSFTLSGKFKKGALASTVVKFSTRIVDTLPPLISAAGVAPGTSGNISIQYAFDFNGRTYTAEVPFTITGKKKSTTGK